MQSKPANRWLDIQIVIVTLVMTITLALWNLFARGSQVDTSVRTAQESVPPSVSSSQPFTRILLGGSAPQVRQAPSSSSPYSAPAPVTVTSSSRP